MTFGAPQYLFALLALPPLVMLVAWSFSRRASSVQRIGDPILVKRLSAAVSLPMRILRIILWFAGVILLIVGLARPQWGSDIEIVEQRGVQVMVALDISRSMLAQDVKPTRLDRAKLEISDLMSRLEGDSVGIVLFSGASFIQFPMTSDYATARAYVHNASPSAISRQGTVIGEAIATAMVGFSDQRVSQRVIVIMTDGESHEGDPVAAARQAAKDDAVIYTVGVGSPGGGPVPEYDDRGQIAGYPKDSQGRTVISQLDEVTLRSVAEAGGGRYFRASEIDAMASLAGEIRSYQDEAFQSEFSQRKVERLQVFLLAGALSLVLAELATDRLSFWCRRRRMWTAEGAAHV